MSFGRNYFDKINIDSLKITDLIAGIIGLIFIIGYLVAYILYLVTLYRNLKLISLKNRKMDSALVWLNLIPLFNLGWMFYTIYKIKESNELEFCERKIQGEADFGFNIGLAYCILSCSLVIPCLNYLTGLPTLVCWIIYWVKVAGMIKSLGAPLQTGINPSSQQPLTPQQ